MNDLEARALSLRELAERHRYADDPGIARLASETLALLDAIEDGALVEQE